MTIREALREGTALLQKAGVPDADVDACLLLADLLREDTLVLRIEGQRELSEEKQREFEALLARREKREPLQYILGETEFMGLAFHSPCGHGNRLRTGTHAAQTRCACAGYRHGKRRTCHQPG